VNLTPPGDHCQAIMESRHPDVFEMDAASRTGIGDIREILESVRYAPVSARNKVYIIDEVHMLSTAAFNGLLKTLEEPPPHVKFIFATTEIRKVPVTVLSRTQRFDLKRVSPDVLAANLKAICDKEGVAVDAAGLMLIARAAEGSVRDAQSLLDQAIVQAGETKGKKKAEAVTAEAIRDMLGLADRGRVIDLFAAIAKGDVKTALTEMRAQYDRGADPALIVRDLLEIGHEAARVQALGADVGGSGEDWAKKIRTLADSQTPAQLSRLWQMLLKALEDVAKAPEPIAAAEMAVVRLCAAANLPSPEEAARMLRSGPAPETHPAPEAGGPKKFEDVVALLDQHRLVGLQSDVERYVQIMEFAPGRIVFAPGEGAPSDLAAKLGRTLKDLTGDAWDVRSERGKGIESLAAARAREQAAALAELKRHPFIADALAAFPGAEIVDVRDPPQEKPGEVVDMKRKKEG
jgi:DNA polymerase-3 subunit gamma/tau